MNKGRPSIDLFCLVEYELTWGDPTFSNLAKSSVGLELLNQHFSSFDRAGEEEMGSSNF
jgi:hypothetical protein